MGQLKHSRHEAYERWAAVRLAGKVSAMLADRGGGLGWVLTEGPADELDRERRLLTFIGRAVLAVGLAEEALAAASAVVVRVAPTACAYAATSRRLSAALRRSRSS